MQIDLNKLNRTIKYSGVKVSILAIKIGVSRTTLWSRLTNKSEFTPDEVVQLIKALRLNETEQKEIFNISPKNDYIPQRVYHAKRDDRN